MKGGGMKRKRARRGGADRARRGGPARGRLSDIQRRLLPRRRASAGRAGHRRRQPRAVRQLRHAARRRRGVHPAGGAVGTRRGLHSLRPRQGRVIRRKNSLRPETPGGGSLFYALCRRAAGIRIPFRKRRSPPRSRRSGRRSFQARARPLWCCRRGSRPGPSGRRGARRSRAAARPCP